MADRPKPFAARLIQHWYHPQDGAFGGLERAGLWLISGIYRLLWAAREFWYRSVHRPARWPGIHVIGIGNLVAGGAGKTPSVMAIAPAFLARSQSCAIITRGYRSESAAGPVRIVHHTDLIHTPASTIGDEAWLLAWHTGLPVASGPDRQACLRALRHVHPELRVVLLDDGLQQRDLHCDQTILVVDERGFGNGHCLPFGPLREPVGNLSRYSGIIFNDTDPQRYAQRALPMLQSTLRYSAPEWVALHRWYATSGAPPAAPTAAGQHYLAIAGIAVPERFFAALRHYGFTFTVLDLDDHDPLTVPKVTQAWQHGHYDGVLMTEKDAVKFLHGTVPFIDRCWALRRTPMLREDFLKRLIDGSQTA